VTFTGLARTIQDVADQTNLPLPHTDFQIPVGRIIMPFVKVPANIARFVYRNSPVALAFPSSGLRAELNAGGATRDLAIAKLGLGTMASLGPADLAISNTMTGRGPSTRRSIARGEPPATSPVRSTSADSAAFADEIDGPRLKKALDGAQRSLDFALCQLLGLPEAKLGRRIALRYVAESVRRASETGPTTT
jgi:hypothetical protein